MESGFQLTAHFGAQVSLEVRVAHDVDSGQQAVKIDPARLQQADGPRGIFDPLLGRRDEVQWLAPVDGVSEGEGRGRDCLAGPMPPPVWRFLFPGDNVDDGVAGVENRERPGETAERVFGELEEIRIVGCLDAVERLPVGQNLIEAARRR
jgi:hypothetical protein